MIAVEPVDIDEQIAVIEARARRRLRWRVPPIAAVGSVVGVAFGRVTGTRHHHHHDQHGNPVLGFVLAGVVCAVGILVLVLIKRRRGRFFPFVALALGQNRDQRRAVRRDLRHGTPSADPLLAEVERRTAQRMARQGRHHHIVFPAVVVVMAINIALPDRTLPGRIFFAVALVGFALAWPLQLRNLRRLRAFDEQVR